LGLLEPHFLGIGIVPDLVETSPSPTHVTVPTHSRSNGMGIDRDSKEIGDAEAPPLGMGAWPQCRNTPVAHMCYHAKFCRFRSNGTCVITEIQRKNLTDAQKSRMMHLPVRLKV